MGIPAKDYDILNDFGETDCVVDLFAEIENAYDGNPSIFDDFTPKDVIMAFFPCTRFENQIMLSFRGQSHGMEGWSIIRKMENCMRLQDELTRNYKIVNKMFIVCQNRGLRLILENPYSKEHFLQRYWCLSPKVIDKDRSKNGDYFTKPTQFWFLNIEPNDNPLEEYEGSNLCSIDYMWRKLSDLHLAQSVTNGKIRNMKVARSMIHPDYANRFIRRYIL